MSGLPEQQKQFARQLREVADLMESGEYKYGDGGLTVTFENALIDYENKAVRYVTPRVRVSGDLVLDQVEEGKDRCSCGERQRAECPGEWEQGCDLGSNPDFVGVAEEDEQESLLWYQDAYAVLSVLRWHMAELVDMVDAYNRYAELAGFPKLPEHKIEAARSASDAVNEFFASRRKRND